MSNYPSAQYSAPDISKSFLVENVTREFLTADGVTTGPSPYLIETTNGTYVDKDKPAVLNLNSSMGVLRGYVTTLQDNINIYLTERIQESGKDAIDPEELLGEEENVDDGEKEDELKEER